MGHEVKIESIKITTSAKASTEEGERIELLPPGNYYIGIAVGEEDVELFRTRPQALKETAERQAYQTLRQWQATEAGYHQMFIAACIRFSQKYSELRKAFCEAEEELTRLFRKGTENCQKQHEVLPSGKHFFQPDTEAWLSEQGSELDHPLGDLAHATLLKSLIIGHENK